MHSPNVFIEGIHVHPHVAAQEAGSLDVPCNCERLFYWRYRVFAQPHKGIEPEHLNAPFSGKQWCANVSTSRFAIARPHTRVVLGKVVMHNTCSSLALDADETQAFLQRALHLVAAMIDCGSMVRLLNCAEPQRICVYCLQLSQDCLSIKMLSLYI